MEESAPSAAGSINVFLCQYLKVDTVISSSIRNHIHDPSPASAQTHNSVALTDRPHGHGPYRRIQTGDVSAACKNPNSALIFRQF